MKTLFGDLNVRETDEQAAFVQWFRAQFPDVLLHSIPNGAYFGGQGDPRARAAIERSAKQMARLKREGLLPGVPDLLIPKWRLYIEMKRSKGGRLSPEQTNVIAWLRNAGFEVIVAAGFEDAIKQVLTFRRRKT